MSYSLLSLATILCVTIRPVSILLVILTSYLKNIIYNVDIGLLDCCAMWRKVCFSEMAPSTYKFIWRYNSEDQY